MADESRYKTKNEKFGPENFLENWSMESYRETFNL